MMDRGSFPCGVKMEDFEGGLAEELQRRAAVTPSPLVAFEMRLNADREVSAGPGPQIAIYLRGNLTVERKQA